MTASPESLRLLLVNFQMDRRSPVLAWQQRVARELARRCAHVTVLTEHVGEFQPEPNLDVRLVPRASCRAPLRWLGAKWLAALPIAALARAERFDACFVHMSYEWVRRLWPFLEPCGVPILLWYAHGSVNWRLRLSHRLADRVVTSSPEGFRLRSDKTVVVGQAIDTELYRPLARAGSRTDVVSVGRIAPRKRTDLVIDAFAAARELRPDLRLRLVGPTLPGDRAWAEDLRARVVRRGLAGSIEWTGSVAPESIAEVHRTAFVHLNVSRTGSMDKSVLEALACGCPVLTSNEAFRGLLGSRGLFLENDEPVAIGRRIVDLRAGPAPEPGELRELVLGRHDLPGTVGRIVEQLAALREEVRCASFS